MRILKEIHRRTSIKTKGVVYVVALILVIYLSVSIVVLSSARKNLNAQLNQFHLSIARKLAVTASDSIVSDDYGFLMEQIRRLKSAGQIKHAKIVDRRGIVISSDDLQMIGGLDKGLLEKMKTTIGKDPIPPASPEADVVVPVEIDGDLLGAVEVEFDWEAENRALDLEFRKTIIQLVYIAVIIFAVGVSGAFVVSMVLTRPIRNLLREIEEFEREIQSGSGELSDPSDRDETVQLRHAFHCMTENLRNYLREFKKMSEDRERLTCMATVGQMSAQIAHEIRNSLYAIRGAISGIKRSGDLSEVQEYIEIIKDETVEMTMMADEFLRFARIPSPSPVPCNIDDIINKVIELLEPDFEEGKVTVVRRGGDAAEVMGDPTLLKQAFMNLFINAVQAMEGGGRIYVEYRRSGDALEVLVEDTGPGIPGEMAPRIFQPFFTTKAEGSGLGLATVYKIIVAHHGDIRILDSERGARFLITLPLAEAGRLRRESGEGLLKTGK